MDEISQAKERGYLVSKINTANSKLVREYHKYCDDNQLPVLILEPKEKDANLIELRAETMPKTYLTAEQRQHLRMAVKPEYLNENSRLHIGDSHCWLYRVSLEHAEEIIKEWVQILDD